MPTPFTHLECAQRFLKDERIPLNFRDLLMSEKSAFLLGNIAADARVGSGAPRNSTHFYAYGKHFIDHPWRLMMRDHEELWHPNDAAHRAFIAGYVAHLSIDEYWSLKMVSVHFFNSNWEDQYRRFLILHIILIIMDQRDLALLESWQAEALANADPDRWLRFLSDNDLIAWRDLIYDQIKPDGESQTFEIFGDRTGIGPEALKSLMATEEDLYENLWQHVPNAVLASVEDGMYHFAVEQMVTYLTEASKFEGKRTR